MPARGGRGPGAQAGGGGYPPEDICMKSTVPGKYKYKPIQIQVLSVLPVTELLQPPPALLSSQG